MAKAIVHRGPDEDGFLERPGLHLANRRLSIVGLADGKQPITNEDGTVWVVFNGELFDYPEQKARLEAKGHVFRTHTDTELIPHLWEEHREKMFDHLKGQFAFCLWDSGARIHPRPRPGRHLPALHDRPPDRRHGLAAVRLGNEGAVRVRPRAGPAGPSRLNHVFTFFAMPGPATVFEGVTSLPPGQYLHVRPGTGSPESLTSPKTYWHPSYPDHGQEDYGRDEAKTVDEYERLLNDAVERRLRADVPVVSYLTGGVDSSLVVAMANKSLGRPIPTFTIAVQDKGLNEENEAPSRPSTSAASRRRADRPGRTAERLPRADRRRRVPGDRYVLPGADGPGESGAGGRVQGRADRRRGGRVARRLPVVQSQSPVSSFDGCRG